MLAKPDRLHTDRDYARLFAKGKAFHGRGVTVKVFKSGIAKSKIGFVVSTKVAKKANVRNVIKRRMREIVREYLSTLAPGYDVAFMARSEVKDLDFSALRTAMVEVMKKAGLLPR